MMILPDKAEGYLAYKWGMRDLLLEDHPYKNTRPTIDPPFVSTPSQTSTNTRPQLTHQPIHLLLLFYPFPPGSTFDLSSQETNPRFNFQQ